MKTTPDIETRSRAEEPMAQPRRPQPWYRRGPVIAAGVAIVVLLVGLLAWLVPGSGDESQVPATTLVEETPDTPEEPAVVSAPPAEVAQAYAAALNGGDVGEVTALFAEGGTFLGSDIASQEVGDDLAFRSIVGETIQLSNCATTGQTATCEFTGTSDLFRPLAIEVFGQQTYTVVDGLITSLEEITNQSSDEALFNAWTPYAVWIYDNHPDVADQVVVYEEFTEGPFAGSVFPGPPVATPPSAELHLQLIEEYLTAPAISGTEGPAPAEVASQFEEALNRGDAVGVTALFADGAIFLGNDIGSPEAQDDLAFRVMVNERLELSSCTTTGQTATCAFTSTSDFLSPLGAQVSGRQVYTVADGLITELEEIPTQASDEALFEAWTPYAVWIYNNHPDIRDEMVAFEEFAGAPIVGPPVATPRSADLHLSLMPDYLALAQ